MKKTLYLFLVGAILAACSEDAKDDTSQVAEDTSEAANSIPATVAIPDEAFEQALIDLNFDDELDGTVLLDNIDFVQDLQLNEKGITDLTGIAAFTQLENLNVRGNALTDLDVSSNNLLKFIWVEDNALETITISGLSLLEKLGADRNQLPAIAVRGNGALQLLSVSENRLQSVDVSNNSALTSLNVIDNPLTCILVNADQLANIPLDWTKDDNDTYALDCE